MTNILDWFTKNFFDRPGAKKKSTSNIPKGGVFKDFEETSQQQEEETPKKSIGSGFFNNNNDKKSSAWENFRKTYFKNNKPVTFDGSWKNRNKIFKAVDKGRIINIDSPNSVRYLDKATGEMLMPSERAMYGDTLHENIKSTAVQNVKYDPDRNVCSVVFTGGSKAYDYRMTPKEFETFMESLSKGRHVNYVMAKYNLMPGYVRKRRRRS